MLTETLLLGIFGLVLGALLGWELASALVHVISAPGEPAAFRIDNGLVVFLSSAGIGLAAALPAGFWPAWRASRTAPAVDLKQTASGRAAHRLGRWIVPIQVALGVVLLNAALLLTNSLAAYLRENSGFAAGNALLADLELGEDSMTSNETQIRALDYLHQVETAPGVQSAAIMSMAPLRGGFSVGSYYSRDSQGKPHVNEQIWPESVSRNYFSVIGTRILHGRAFTPSDATGERVCILSAGAAAYFFPGKSAIGEILSSGDTKEKPADRESFRVVGIAEDARIAGLLDPAPFVAYFPIEREKGSAFVYSTIGVRATTPQIAADAIRRVQSRVFPEQAPFHIWFFRDAINFNLSRQRLLSGVSGGFALLALALVASGLYGILSRTVTERRREIGIRMALGAKRKQIVVGLARSAAIRITVGFAAGAILFAVAGRMLQSLLDGIAPESPRSASMTLIVLLAVLTIAFIVPAIRAASVQPMDAIREE